MSIILSHQDGWILCHSSYLHELYQTIEDEEICSCGKYEVFHISSPFLKHGQKTHSDSSRLDQTKLMSLPVDQATAKDRSLTFNYNEVLYVKRAFDRLMNDAKQPKSSYFKRCTVSHSNNKLAMNAADRILKNTDDASGSLEFNGGNNDGHAISVTLGKVNYFIPPLCRFYCCSVHRLHEKLMNQDASLFDVILLDPPWWNKYVRRKNARDRSKGYKMMFNQHLMEIPINSILTPDGLVVVWCTNSKQHISHLINDIFPAWKISYVTSWYWMKITDNCTPICDFSNDTTRKQPFERIIFGSRNGRSDKHKNPDPSKLIISIPSAIHSHKPPLTNVLSEYIPPGSLCIELFARYLIPNWTSCGDEVLKLQHESLFTKSRDVS